MIVDLVEQCRAVWPCLITMALCATIPIRVHAGAPVPGIIEQTINMKEVPVTGEFVAFARPAFNNTQISIRFHCDAAISPSFKFKAQFVLRSSPCEREIMSVMAYDNANAFDKIANTYFSVPTAVSQERHEHHLTQHLYYISPVKEITCGPAVDFEIPDTEKPVFQVVQVKDANAPPVTSTTTTKKPEAAKKVKRAAGSAGVAPQAPPVASKTSADAQPGDRALSTTHPAITTTVDAVYLLIVKILPPENEVSKNGSCSVSLEVRWKAPSGYLSAGDYPLLPFFGIMCGVYGIYAIVWFCVSACYWKDLLRIQFWIGAVILLGMVEKALFTAEYEAVNATGRSVEGTIQLAELISCLKRTLARMLVIIVSVGFGVVKPRLGTTLHKVVAVGFFYFILSSIEGTVRVTKDDPDTDKQKRLALLPLTLLEVAIFWWIFTSLTNTMRALRLRRNEVKLSLYRHFTNTLIFSLVASVIYMCWSLAKHQFDTCLKDWKEIWVDTAFWHVLFSVILLVIMVLWRPSNNNQRYAFTPLLDNDEDEEDDVFIAEDTLFTGAFTTGEQMMMRGIASTTKPENRKDRSNDAQMDLERELKWVEENIPSSIADKLVADSDEEREQTEFEVSKMQ